MKESHGEQEDPVPGHALEQADVVDIHPREGGNTSLCDGCGAVKVTHVCHGPEYRCSDCCDDASAGEGDCQRFIARKRADTLLVNRRHVPAGWGDPGDWPRVDREVVEIGRANGGDAVMTNTEPGADGWLGNPYRLKSAGGSYTREESVQKYREVFYAMAAENAEFRSHVRELRGSILLGWCVPELCHGDVVLEWLDRSGE